LENALKEDPIKVLEEDPARFFSAYEEVFGSFSLKVFSSKLVADLEKTLRIHVDPHDMYVLLHNNKLLYAFLESGKTGPIEVEEMA